MAASTYGSLENFTYRNSFNPAKYSWSPRQSTGSIASLEGAGFECTQGGAGGHQVNSQDFTLWALSAAFFPDSGNIENF